MRLKLRPKKVLEGSQTLKIIFCRTVLVPLKELRTLTSKMIFSRHIPQQLTNEVLIIYKHNNVLINGSRQKISENSVLVKMGKSLLILTHINYVD